MTKTLLAPWMREGHHFIGRLGERLRLGLQPSAKRPAASLRLPRDYGIGPERGVPIAPTAIASRGQGKEIGHVDANGTALREISSPRFSKTRSSRTTSSTSSQSASGPARTNGNDGSMSCSVEPGRSAPAPGCQWSAPTRCEGCTALWPPGSERQGRWWPRPWVTPRSTSPSATTWTGMFWRAPVCEATFGCFKAAQAR